MSFLHILLHFRLIRNLWLIILILRNHRIIYGLSNIFEDIQSYLWGDIEELSVLSDTQIRQTIYRFMHQLLHLVVLCSLHGCKDFER